MIISVSGRKTSGKSSLIKPLIEQGYMKVSFADRLKELTAKIFSWDLQDLYTEQGKEEEISPVAWGRVAAEKLSEILGLKSLSYEDKLFYRRREALQYLGTEVLRKHDPEFHVKEFKKRIDPDKNYVIDDCRFHNELKTLKQLKSKCLFIIRPYYFNYSNHLSEIELNRTNFSQIIMNSRDEKYLQKEFNNFLKNKLKPLKKPEHNFNAFLKPTKNSAWWAGIIFANGSLQKHGKYGYRIKLKSKQLETELKEFLKIDSKFISCPYIIEDLKLWRIDPWSKNQPDCIKNNEALFKTWKKGIEHAK